MEDLTPLEELYSDLEVLMWNDSFGIYSEEEFDTMYDEIINKIEQEEEKSVDFLL